MKETMELPCEECGGQCCNGPSLTREEFNLLKSKYGIPAKADIFDTGVDYVVFNGVCPYLIKGRCSVYEDRPKICRDYGIIPTMPCKYLMKLKGSSVSPEEV